MDRIAQQANQSRSLRGSSFESGAIGKILLDLKERKRIKDFAQKPKIYNGEFNPDFIIEKKNGEIVCVDSTTTARTDRLRGKQWDAHGTKMFYLEMHKKNITACVVVQDTHVSKREEDNFRRCKAHCALPHSALDHVFSVEEFVAYLEK